MPNLKKSENASWWLRYSRPQTHIFYPLGSYQDRSWKTFGWRKLSSIVFYCAFLRGIALKWMFCCARWPISPPGAYSVILSGLAPSSRSLGPFSIAHIFLPSLRRIFGGVPSRIAPSQRKAPSKAYSLTTTAHPPKPQTVILTLLGSLWICLQAPGNFLLRLIGWSAECLEEACFCSWDSYWSACSAQGSR